MKTKKMIARLKALLSEDERKRLAELDSLEELVEKLGRREKKLEGKLAAAEDADTERYRKKIEMVRAHRKKGQDALAELRDDSAPDG